MDEDQARAALAEVDRRRGEATRIAEREGAPVWFALVAGAVVVALSVVSDVRTQVPGWNGWFTKWAVPVLGLAVIAACAVLVYRRAAVTAHRSATGRQMAEIAVALVAFYLVAMAIGMPMRYYDVPFDQTVSTLGAAVLVAAGWFVWRRVVAPPGAERVAITPSQPAGFSELIHAPTRLSLMSLLSASNWMEFGLLRDTMEMTDSALSKQLATLEEAGLVALQRDGVGRGKRVRVRLTPQGRQAFDVHVGALRAIVERSGAWEQRPAHQDETA